MNKSKLITLAAVLAISIAFAPASSSQQVLASTYTSGSTLNLNGTSAYVEVAHNAGLNPSAAMTIEAWVRLSSIDADCHTILGKQHRTQKKKRVCVRDQGRRVETTAIRHLVAVKPNLHAVLAVRNMDADDLL